MAKQWRWARDFMHMKIIYFRQKLQGYARVQPQILGDNKERVVPALHSAWSAPHGCDVCGMAEDTGRHNDNPDDLYKSTKNERQCLDGKTLQVW